jgi:hypothetical protein
MATSRLFPPGTIYASALTPVIVAAVSEMLNRPANRVSELRQQRRTLVSESRRLETARVVGGEPSPLRGAPEFAQGDAAYEELGTNGDTNGGSAGPSFAVYGSRRSPRRILHPKVWIATGLAAFAIAVAVLTLPELIFGGAVATPHETTFFGGGTSHPPKPRTKAETTTTTTPTKSAPTTVTETVPATTPTPTTPTQTTTTDTGTTTAPSGGSAAPSDTGTSTSPSGAAVPPPVP